MYLKKYTILLFLSILQFSGCQYLPDVSMPDLSLPDISMPSLGFEEEQPKEPAIPISVVYAFDPSVTDATLEIQACDLPYTLQTGENIIQTFLALGQETFQSVRAYSGTGQAVHATQPSDLVIQISMVNQSFQAADRMAEEDNYLVNINLKLQAVFIDTNGTELGQIPLNFSGQVRVWAPALTGQSISCTTGQYDAKINGVAAELAEQLVEVVPNLLKNGSPQPLLTTQNRQPVFTPQSSPPSRPQFAEPSSTRPFFTFRTMLKDGNDNLILEGGETIVLIIEATNVGSTAMTTTTANVVGNATLVKAFSRMTPLPISMGTFQPGETKTTEIRGRMPLDVSGQKAELVVSLRLEDGTSIGSHRIVAPLQPGAPSTDVQAGPKPSLQKPKTAPKKTQDRRSSVEEGPQDSDTMPSQEEAYVAMLIGMDAYRDTWPEAYHIPPGHLTTLQDSLKNTGLFADQNIRILQGHHTAKSAIERTLLTWVRQRIGKESVLILYFSGQAVKDQKTGEVYLVPYEGSPDTSTNQLISLRMLQRLLGKLQNRLTLLILDAPIAPVGEQQAVEIPVRWTSGLLQKDKTPVIQLRKRQEPGNGDPANILAGLLGQTDVSRNGTITVGEFLDNASASSEITLLLPDSSPLLAIPLAR